MLVALSELQNICENGAVGGDSSVVGAAGQAAGAARGAATAATTGAEAGTEAGAEVDTARHAVSLPMRLPEWQKIQIIVTAVGIAASTNVVSQSAPARTHIPAQRDPPTSWVLLRADGATVEATVDGTVGLAAAESRQTTEIDATVSAARVRIDAGRTRSYVSPVPPLKDAQARLLRLKKVR